MGRLTCDLRTDVSMLDLGVFHFTLHRNGGERKPLRKRAVDACGLRLGTAEDHSNMGANIKRTNTTQPANQRRRLRAVDSLDVVPVPQPGAEVT